MAQRILVIVLMVNLDSLLDEVVKHARTKVAP